jgi:PhnB protein
MGKTAPYIMFDGMCRDAMTFYQQCLGGNLTIMTVAESPMAAQMPAEMANRVLHADLESGDIRIMASDSMGDKFADNGMVTVCLFDVDNGSIQQLFDALSDGGSIEHPLETAFFGTIGDFTDKFGVRWMLTSRPAADAAEEE